LFDIIKFKGEIKNLKNKAGRRPIQNSTQLLNTLSVCFD